ncbi:MAG: MFS transporter [Chloroflexi bacterium]|nr:MFS transporter [Chloroflexota bacterium]
MHAKAGSDTLEMPRRTATIVLVILCQGFQIFSVSGVGLLLPMIRTDLGLSFTQGGMLSVATMLSYVIMQVPGGYLADRFGRKCLFAIGVLGTTVLTFTFSLTQVYWQALANQAVTGIFRAFIFTSALALLSGWFPPERRATAIGLGVIGPSLGNITLDVGGPFLAVSFGWRVAFLSFATVAIIITVVMLRFAKEPPVPLAQPQSALTELFKVSRYPAMWVCGVLQFVRMAVLQVVTFWLPTLLVDEKGIALQLAGMLMAIQSGLVGVSGPLGGYLSDRLRKPALVTGFSFAILSITMVLLVRLHNIGLLIIVIAFSAIFVQLSFGPLFNVPAKIVGARLAGTSTGFLNTFAILGGIIFTYVLGALKDVSNSFGPGFYTVSAACVIGLVFTFVLHRMLYGAKASATTFRTPS